MPRLLDLGMAARYLGDLAPRTIRGLLGRGLLHQVHIPGLRRTLIDRADLDRLVETWKDPAEVVPEGR